MELIFVLFFIFQIIIFIWVNVYKYQSTINNSYLYKIFEIIKIYISNLIISLQVLVPCHVQQISCPKSKKLYTVCSKQKLVQNRVEINFIYFIFLANCLNFQLIFSFSCIFCYEYDFRHQVFLFNLQPTYTIHVIFLNLKVCIFFNFSHQFFNLYIIFT